MGLPLGTNFELNAEKFNFERDSFATLAEMKAFPLSSVPDGFTAFCEQDFNHYIMCKGCNPSDETGYWRNISTVTDFFDNPVDEFNYSRPVAYGPWREDRMAIVGALTNKVDKVTGKGLSTNDYTTAEKQKLAGLSNYDDNSVVKSIKINGETKTPTSGLVDLGNVGGGGASKVTELTDVSNASSASKDTILTANGDGTFSFIELNSVNRPNNNNTYYNSPIPSRVKLRDLFRLGGFSVFSNNASVSTTFKVGSGANEMYISHIGTNLNLYIKINNVVLFNGVIIGAAQNQLKNSPCMYSVDFINKVIRAYDSRILAAPIDGSFEEVDLSLLDVLLDAEVFLNSSTSRPVDVCYLFNHVLTDAEFSELQNGNRFGESLLPLKYDSAVADKFTTFNDISNIYAITGTISAYGDGFMVESAAEHGNNYVTSEVFSSIDANTLNKKTLFKVKMTVLEGTVQFGGFTVNGRTGCVVKDSNGDVVTGYVGAGVYLVEGIAVRTDISKYVLNFKNTSNTKVAFENLYITQLGCVCRVDKTTFTNKGYLTPKGEIVELSGFFEYIPTITIKQHTSTAIDADFVGQHLIVNQDMYICVGLPRVWKKITP